MKIKIILLLLAAMVVTSVGACSCLAKETNASQEGREDKGYIIGPENSLLIDVYYGRDETLSRKLRVSSGGVINFPLLGRVEIAGLTISEAEKKISELLEKDYLVNPQVSVFIEEYSTVSILGQVKTPGSYEMKGRLTIVELISMAGGFTKIAATNNVKIMRTGPDGKKTTFTVKVNDVINRGREEDNIRLETGDIVTVGESFF